MKKISELMARDLNRRIEEVIKLNQQDEQTVYHEITEYVATQKIKEQYRDLLREIAGGRSKPDEAVGVWISGFFGSGKSSFAKNLGYIVANLPLQGQPASQVFVEQLRQQAPGDALVDEIEAALQVINLTIPTYVIMFDVQLDRDVLSTNEPLAKIMYTVLLRELNYALDYDLAEVEIELEGEGKLADFIRLCAEQYPDDKRPDDQLPKVPVNLAGITAHQFAAWERVRAGGQAIQRTSAILNLLDPKTYPETVTWAQTLLKNRTQVSVRTLVSRAFELIARRHPGHTLSFVIDEVGRYVASSAEKIENLRAVVEEFGKESRNRVLAGKAVAPVWIIITSQEKLNEVVAAIGDKRVEIAKVQDRFRYKIDMAPSDIREVATKRVLAKTPEAEPVLRQLFKEWSGQLRTNINLERSLRIKSDISEDEFVQFYPYLPHFVELSIDIVSGLRQQGDVVRQIGGSNRTIIKQAYEMLVDRRTRLADASIGELVTLDRIYDLLEANLPSEKKRDLALIEKQSDDEKNPWLLRTAKAIVLMEYVRGLPRIEKNIAALLHRNVKAQSALQDVEAAVKQLEAAQYIRRTDEGFKLLTPQERTWADERKSFSPTIREREDILEAAFSEIFDEPAFSRYMHYKRTFQVSVAWRGRTVIGRQAQIPVELRTADAPDAFEAEGQATLNDCRNNRKKVFWLLNLNDTIDDWALEVFRSLQMVNKYDQLRSQGKLTGEEGSLNDEKRSTQVYQDRLKAALLEAFQRGNGYFDGNTRPGASLGRTATEIFQAMLGYAVPQLYPKLQMITNITLKGTEADEILRAATLTNALSPVFFEGDNGLGLVTKEGGKYTINAKAPIAREIQDKMQADFAYGNKVTGRSLEDHFGGLGYGWDRDFVVLTLAALLRGGFIEVTHQGRRYRNHLDPQVRAVLAGTNSFRAASFAPRKAPDLQTLVRAAKSYEALTGEEADVDEVAIAQAVQKFAREEREALTPLEALARANQMGKLIIDTLADYRNTLDELLNGASDDVVNTMAGEGGTLQEIRRKVQEMHAAADAVGLRRLSRLRVAVRQIWPTLAERVADPQLASQMAHLQELLDQGTYYQTAKEVDQVVSAIEMAYHALYQTRHAERASVYQEAVDFIKGLDLWAQAITPNPGADDPAAARAEKSRELESGLLAPLIKRICVISNGAVTFTADSLICQACNASLAEMESDLDAVQNLRDRAIRRLQELVTPEEKFERVRVAEVVSIGRTLSNEKEVEEALGRLREHLLKLIAAGVKVILE